MAKTQTHHASINMPTLVLFVSVAIISLPAALVNVDASPPEKLEVYFPLAGTAEVSVGNGTGFGTGGGFGTISVYDAIGQAGPGEDSAKVGQIAGQAITILNDLRFVTATTVLNISGYAGSISSQGVTSADGSGQTAIIGGTGDFFAVTGVLEGVVITPQVLNKLIFYIKYA